MKVQYKNLIDKALDGSRKSISSLVTLVENKEITKNDLLSVLKPSFKTKTIGVTGAPGVGKSSLISALANCFDGKLAIVSIDPSSTISGGSFLGDRVRMSSIKNKNVFIRSFSDQCHCGGLTPFIEEVIILFKVLEFHYLIIETVGVGQSSVKIRDFVDIVLLVLDHSVGDDIQMNKSGILELADFIVVNKSDLEGASKVKSYITDVIKNGPQENMISLRTGNALEKLNRSKPQILSVSSTNGSSIQTLANYLK